MSAHHVYRLRDTNGCLLYVGCTSDVERRIAEHRKAGTGGGARISSWTEESYPTREEALFAEAIAIRDENPEVNILGGTAAIGLDLTAIASRPAATANARVSRAVATAARDAGFTSVALAGATDIPAITLHRLLLGASFNVAQLAAIASVLDVPFLDLLGEDAA